MRGRRIALLRVTAPEPAKEEEPEEAPSEEEKKQPKDHEED